MSKIIVELPKDRTVVGTLRLVANSGSIVAGPFSAVGCADRERAASEGNSAADRQQLYGDTPHGTFAVVDLIKTGPHSEFSDYQYGPHGAIRLRPIGGEAAAAAVAGRTGLMIHGGELGTADRLRPTVGSLRLSNADISALIQSIAMLSVSEGPPELCEVTECSTGLSKIAEGNEIVSESDPPPGMAGDWYLDAIAKARAGSEARAHEDVHYEYVQEKEKGHDRAAEHDRSSEGHDRDVHDREARRDPAGHDRSV